MTFWKLLHVVFVGLFSGSQLAMLALHLRAMGEADPAQRLTLARTSAWAGRVVLMPAMYLAFFSGLAFWGVVWNFKGGPYVHDMLLSAFFAVGFAQMWKARARKAAVALAEGATDEARGHFAKGRTFVLVSLALTLLAYVSALTKASLHP